MKTTNSFLCLLWNYKLSLWCFVFFQNYWSSFDISFPVSILSSFIFCFLLIILRLFDALLFFSLRFFMQSLQLSCLFFSSVLNGQISPTPKNNEKLPGFHEYQIKFVKNLIEDSMDEFRYKQGTQRHLMCTRYNFWGIVIGWHEVLLLYVNCRTPCVDIIFFKGDLLCCIRKIWVKTNCYSWEIVSRMFLLTFPAKGVFFWSYTSLCF